MYRIIPCIMLLVRQPFLSVVFSKKFHINKSSIVQVLWSSVTQKVENTCIKPVTTFTQNIQYDFTQLQSKKTV